MVTSCIFNHISNQFSRNGRSTLVLFVLPGIEKVRNDGSDSFCTGSLASMNHDQQFHKRGVGWRWCSIWRGRHTWSIDNIDVMLSNWLGNPNNGFTCLISCHCSSAQRLSKPERRWKFQRCTLGIGITKATHRLATSFASSTWLVPEIPKKREERKSSNMWSVRGRN